MDYMKYLNGYIYLLLPMSMYLKHTIISHNLTYLSITNKSNIRLGIIHKLLLRIH